MVNRSNDGFSNSSVDEVSQSHQHKLRKWLNPEIQRKILINRQEATSNKTYWEPYPRTKLYIKIWNKIKKITEWILNSKNKKEIETTEVINILESEKNIEKSMIEIKPSHEELDNPTLQWYSTHNQINENHQQTFSADNESKESVVHQH